MFMNILKFVGRVVVILLTAVSAVVGALLSIIS